MSIMTKKKTKIHEEPNRALDAVIAEAQELEKERQEDNKTSPPAFGVSRNEPEHDIGKRLQQAREAKGFTQGQLAELTKRVDKDNKGISRAVISLYEAGTNRPGPREMRLLCECLRVTPSYLVYGDDDPFGSLTDYGRFRGMGRSEAEYYANITYLFSRLHHHHSEAIFKIMQDLLRLWEKGFDAKMQKEAFPMFLEMAEQLREELNFKAKK